MVGNPGAGGGTFLGWAIARELDPDRPWSAGVAAVLAFVVSFIGDPMLAVAGVALLASRIAVRSTVGAGTTDLADKVSSHLSTRSVTTTY